MPLDARPDGDVLADDNVLITIGKVPGALQRLSLPRGTPVNVALGEAGVMPERGYKLSVNGDNTVQPTAPINEDSSVLLTRAVSGN